MTDGARDKISQSLEIAITVHSLDLETSTMATKTGF